MISSGDGIDDLTVGENITVPMEMGREVVGGFGDPRSDDEPEPGFIKLTQVATGEHAGISDDKYVDDAVALADSTPINNPRERAGLEPRL